jgi:hypothetical protein
MRTPHRYLSERGVLLGGNKGCNDGWALNSITCRTKSITSTGWGTRVAEFCRGGGRYVDFRCWGPGVQLKAVAPAGDAARTSSNSRRGLLSYTGTLCDGYACVVEDSRCMWGIDQDRTHGRWRICQSRPAYRSQVTRIWRQLPGTERRRWDIIHLIF